jgi:hypothetical protein
MINVSGHMETESSTVNFYGSYTVFTEERPNVYVL